MDKNISLESLASELSGIDIKKKNFNIICNAFILKSNRKISTNEATDKIWKVRIKIGWDDENSNTTGRIQQDCLYFPEKKFYKSINAFAEAVRNNQLIDDYKDNIKRSAHNKSDIEDLIILLNKYVFNNQDSIVIDEKNKNANYWIFQGNPRIYDITSALQNGHLRSWKVAAHKDKISPGDKVVLWQTGDNAGCYALAEVISDVGMFPEEPEELKYYFSQTENDGENNADRVKIEITNNLADNPLFWSNIKDRSEFANFKAGNQGTNFTATEEQYNTLLKMATQPEFFTQSEFDLLKETDGKKNIKGDIYLNEAYKDLSKAYLKVEYWMNELQRRVFPSGKVHILKKPTNQANNFDGYLWGKIYPTQEDGASKWLAFTVGLDGSGYLNLKIDTVGLDDKDTLRQNYFKYRGAYDNSKIVNRYPFNSINNWQDLLDKSEEDLRELIKHWDEIKALKERGIVNEEAVEYKSFKKHPLNQILYGPPGTGKTYKLQSEYFDSFTLKESSLSKEQYIENGVNEILWWQVIALAVYDLKLAGTTDLLNHFLVKAKANLSTSKNIRALLWSNLQTHTVMECENVNISQRVQPLVFHKDEKSRWSLVHEEINEAFPEIEAMLKSLQTFTPSDNKIIKNYEFVTFHQSFSYEDFVEGIKPKLDEEESAQVSYEIKDGVFKKLALRAKADPENDYAIFIDEINRGNVSAIFGELITLIEEDKRSTGKNPLSVKLPYSKTEFSVPSNLHVFGTMNTADRSVEALDTALRRRFSFKEIMPNPSLLEKIEFDGFNLQEVLETINKRIEFLLDRDHTIGHSYFMDLKSDDTDGLEEVFKNKVIPLLQEYFYHDYEKIALILGSGFVRVEQEHKIEFPEFHGIDTPDPTILCELVNDIEDIEAAIHKLLNRDGE